MTNAEIAQILKEMAAFCEMFRQDFKQRAYELAAADVGPRTVHELYLRLNVKDISDLEKACRNHKVRNLPRFGPKSEARILKEIERVKQSPVENNQDGT